MIDYAAARAVALVVQTGSFEKAAKALGVTPSAISQRVRQLEERLGTVLIDRGTPCTATDQGLWLCRHMEHVGMLEKNLFEHLPGLADQTAGRVTLDIATNADSLGTWFIGAMAQFAETSDYLLNVAIDDQDHTAEWLRRGRVVAAVTSHAEPVAGCQVKSLGRLRYHATASPRFFERYFAGGVTPEAIGNAPALTFNQKDQLQHDWVRHNVGAVSNLPTHWLPSTHGFVDAGMAGMGWGLNPAPLVRGHLEAGRLVELVPGAVLDVPLYWQVSRIAAEQLKGLTTAVLAAAKSQLLQD